MALFKKKYETIECSNEHIFRLEYDGIIKRWKCVVLEDEVVTYEGDKEIKRLKIMDKTRAPQVLQIDTVTTVYGEQIPFQLENGFPFLKLQGEWEPSDTFVKARRDAQVKMYRRNAFQQIGFGAALSVAMLLVGALLNILEDMWIFTIFGILFMSSGAYTLVRLRNELQAYKEVEEESLAEELTQDRNAIAEARALRSGDE